MLIADLSLLTTPEVNGSSANIRTTDDGGSNLRNPNTMININLNTLGGQTLAAKFLAEGWQVVTLDSNSITLQNPSYA